MLNAVPRGHFYSLPLLLLVLFSFSSCALFNNKIDDTEEAYYQSAQDYLDRGSYSMAIEQLETLQSRFPFGRYSEAAALELMYAYFENNDFAESLIEADRFTRFNPEHPNIDYAWFVRGMSYYQLYLQNRGLLYRADPAQRSAEQGVKAFNALSQYTARFPNSEHRDDALAASVVLKDALARHELFIAQYYVRRQAWVSAAERAKTVVDHYPGTEAVADALVIQVEAYNALNLPEESALALAQLESDHADHSVFKSGEYQQPAWMNDRWWVKIFTLGIAS